VGLGNQDYSQGRLSAVSLSEPSQRRLVEIGPVPDRSLPFPKEQQLYL